MADTRPADLAKDDRPMFLGEERPWRQRYGEERAEGECANFEVMKLST
jgi:hypothetical protein